MTTPLVVYAVVPRADVRAWMPASRDVRLISHRRLSAIVGAVPRTERQVQTVRRHHRVVSDALEVCSSVIPFRLGVETASEQDLRQLLNLHARRLGALLGRLAGRVEMGLLAKPAGAAGHCGLPFDPPFDLGEIHALAPSPADRRERLKDPRAMVFEGCYLIARRDIDPFWAALENIRRASPELRLVGSGPWAPYNFCDVVLHPATEPRATQRSQCSGAAKGNAGKRLKEQRG